ncbi:unnamed protein product [Ectocarpus sp. 13 AM-2016]
MHDDETIAMHAPFWAFSGAHRPVKDSTVDGSSGHKTNNAGSGMNNSCSGETGAAGGGESAVAAATAPGKSSSINNSGSRDVVVDGHEGNIADNVDGFLDEFMALAGGIDDDSDYGVMLDEGEGGGGPAISEEDLVFLADMDMADFLPPAATAEEGGALLSPSSVHEMETLPSQGGGVASGPVMTAAAEAALSQAAAAAAAGGGVIGSPAATTAAAPGVETDAGGAARRTENANNQHAAAAVAATAVTGCGGGGGGSDAAAAISVKEQVRRQKVAQYLAKKQRRCWSKPAASSYQSRQRVANSRPRHKGRFLPLESEFVPIAELQRRQRALMVQTREKAAASAATTGSTAAASAAPASATPGTAAVGAPYEAGVSPSEFSHRYTI